MFMAPPTTERPLPMREGSTGREERVGEAGLELLFAAVDDKRMHGGHGVCRFVRGPRRRNQHGQQAQRREKSRHAPG